MAVSICYERVEWAEAAVGGQASEAFLGAQGVVWDAQSDMTLALAWAVVGLVFLSRLHDREMGRIGDS